MRTRMPAVAMLVAATMAISGCASSTESAEHTTSSAVSTTSSATSTTTPSAPSTSAASCVDSTLASLTPQQKAAQLIMIAQQPDGAASTAKVISAGDAGSVILLGKWVGQEAVAAAVEAIDALSASTAGIGIWVSTDQEGGEVQKLAGPGFTTIPSALEQGQLPPADLAAAATTWAQELAAAGVDINLAPVADVVPDSIGTANAPIGQFHREYGATPEAVGPAVLAFAQGMAAGGILATAKHFPSIGRITGNTDETSVGIDDPAMTATDPDLQPFADLIGGGVPLVMVSSASYPQLDPTNKAVFSEPIITGLLRTQLGFGGIVITDDVGQAQAVADVPVPDRATRFVSAGGDIVLTAVPSQAAEMNAAIVASASADPAFAAKVDSAVQRVLTQKDAGKLLPCSA